MPTVVIFSDLSDGALQSGDLSYANAREGLGTVIVSGPTFDFRTLGQLLSGGTSFVFELLLTFDTSILTALALIDSATFFLTSNDVPPAQPFTCEARMSNWTIPYTIADFIPGSLLGAATLLATFNNAVQLNDRVNQFTSEVAFLSALNLTGFTSIVLNSDRHRIGNAPTATSEACGYYLADSSGSERDPRLVVTYHFPPAALGGGPLSSFRKMIHPPQLVSP